MTGDRLHVRATLHSFARNVFSRALRVLLLSAMIAGSPAAAKKRAGIEQGPVSFDRGIEVGDSKHWFRTPSDNTFCNPIEVQKTLVCYNRAGKAFRLESAGSAQSLEGDEASLLQERGDTNWLTDPVLTYGSWISTGSIACLSETRGLTCKNRDEHGFFLSKTNSHAF